MVYVLGGPQGFFFIAGRAVRFCRARDYERALKTKDELASFEVMDAFKEFRNVFGLLGSSTTDRAATQYCTYRCKGGRFFNLHNPVAYQVVFVDGSFRHADRPDFVPADIRALHDEYLANTQRLCSAPSPSPSSDAEDEPESSTVASRIRRKRSASTAGIDDAPEGDSAPAVGTVPHRAGKSPAYVMRIEEERRKRFRADQSHVSSSDDDDDDEANFNAWAAPSAPLMTSMSAVSAGTTISFTPSPVRRMRFCLGGSSSSSSSPLRAAALEPVPAATTTTTLATADSAVDDQCDFAPNSPGLNLFANDDGEFTLHPVESSFRADAIDIDVSVPSTGAPSFHTDAMDIDVSFSAAVAPAADDKLIETAPTTSSALLLMRPFPPVPAAAVDDSDTSDSPMRNASSVARTAEQPLSALRQLEAAVALKITTRRAELQQALADVDALVGALDAELASLEKRQQQQRREHTDALAALDVSLATSLERLDTQLAQTRKFCESIDRVKDFVCNGRDSRSADFPILWSKGAVLEKRRNERIAAEDAVDMARAAHVAETERWAAVEASLASASAAFGARRVAAIADRGTCEVSLAALETTVKESNVMSAFGALQAALARVGL